MTLINADKLIAQWEEDAKHMDDAICQMMTYGAINDVKKQPAIDIVRCKECINRDMIWNKDRWRPATYHCKILDIISADDFFCAYAERRAGDET